MLLLDLIKQLQAVHATALQPDVEEDHVRPTARDRRQRGIAVTRRPRLVTFVLENTGDEVANIGLVIDDQNIIRHCYVPLDSMTGSVGAAGFCACPDAANLSRIQAPRLPGLMLEASFSSIRPP